MDTLLKQCRDALAIIKGETSPDGHLTMLPQQEAFICQTIAACDDELARTDGPSDQQIEAACWAYNAVQTEQNKAYCFGNDSGPWSKEKSDERAKQRWIAALTAAGVRAPRVTEEAVHMLAGYISTMEPFNTEHPDGRVDMARSILNFITEELK